jgi:uncharacterized sporulation protein YeaH/YhbH (DUF444 family)
MSYNCNFVLIYGKIMTKEKVLLLDVGISQTGAFKDILQDFHNFKVDIIRSLDDLIPALKEEIYDILITECIFPQPQNMDDQYFDREL